MKFLILILSILSFRAFAIELVIGGKVYYIEKYQIEENGQKLVIPYTIHLSEEALKTNDCEKPAGNPHQNVVREGRSDFGDLIRSVSGQFEKLQNDLKPTRPKAKPYKQNFR